MVGTTADICCSHLGLTGEGWPALGPFIVENPQLGPVVGKPPKAARSEAQPGGGRTTGENANLAGVNRPH